MYFKSPLSDQGVRLILSLDRWCDLLKLVRGDIESPSNFMKDV